MLTVPRIRAPSYISVFERLIDAIAPMYNESLTDELQETMMKQFVYTPDNVFEIQSSLYGPEANVYIDTKYSKGKYLWSTWIGGNLVLSNTVTDTDSLDDYVTDVVIKIRDNIDAINDAYVLDND
jgi:hypothetical protein